jgi:ComF family protein
MNLFFPSTIYCAACGGLLSGGGGLALCETCAAELALPDGRLCAKCGKPLSQENRGELCGECGQTEHLFSQGYATTVYAGPAMTLVRDMKYRDRPHYAVVIAELMAERWRSLIDAETGEVPHYDLLVNVPASAKKKRARGFDQAELVAAALAPKIGIPFAAGLLRRDRHTAVQSSLSAEERRANLKGAFSVHGGGGVAGLSVLVVDDVYTTGSTMDACAEALFASGAACASVFAFATAGDWSADGWRHTAR